MTGYEENRVVEEVMRLLESYEYGLNNSDEVKCFRDMLKIEIANISIENDD